jgi:enolase
MIQNLKLYTILDGSGAYAIKLKMWTRSGCYQASVPLVNPGPANVSKIKLVFSSIRSNFIGLNEEDWVSVDELITQLNAKTKNIDPGLSMAMSVAAARAATQNDLWKIRGTGRKFPHLGGMVVRGNDWKGFLLIPQRERNVVEAFEKLAEAWKVTGEELDRLGVLRGRSINGAWMTDMGDVDTLYFLSQIAKDWNMRIGLNIGGPSLWNGETYDYAKSTGQVIKGSLSQEEQMTLISALVEQYKVWYVEDPFRSSGFMTHAQLSHMFGDIIVSGRELYAGDLERMKRGYKSRSSKGISMGATDLSTISHLLEISSFASGKGLMMTLSMAERETGDDWLSDLALAGGVDMLNLSISGTGSISKFNRLFELWEDVPHPRMRSTGD